MLKNLFDVKKRRLKCKKCNKIDLKKIELVFLLYYNR